MNEQISPEKIAKEAKSAYHRGDFLQAARSYEAARQAYLVRDDQLNAAEMANNASVAFLQGGDAESALKAAESTAEVFAQASDLRRQGIALGNIGAALDALDHDEEALAFYQQSADVLERAGEDQFRASVMQSLSMLQFRTGRQLQALSTMQHGLEQVKYPSPKQSFLKKLLRIPLDMATRNKPS